MNKYKFIDLFAGIGGFHLALHSLGCECVFASEIDAHARKTYEHNLKKITPNLFEENLFNDDIRNIDPHEIPDFDILCAGFPCQPFSQAGQRRGFDDNHNSERGNLFFNIVDIIKAKKPKAFFLENVRGIVNHDNGETFKVIRHILEDELEYSFHYKIVYASEYGLPQLRPRAFMIGFRDEGFLKNFQFPAAKPLEFNMSDVWGGNCTREIGFTLRVGGRSSPITDRRNWDAYMVDNEIRKIMPEQARKMQGFPDDFEFPVSSTEAMKQLGNSVAVNAVRACAKAIIDHLETLNPTTENMNKHKNKGEWTELYTFLQIIHDQKLLLADKDLNTNSQSTQFKIRKASTLNMQTSCILDDLDESDLIIVENNATGDCKEVHTAAFLNKKVLATLVKIIREGKGTFNIPEFELIENELGISIVKGGNSKQKSDIVLSIENETISKTNEGFSIKSYLGSSPTLLNASGNTNFIYEVKGLKKEHIDLINGINEGQKLIARLEKIYELGGSLEFSCVEKPNFRYNLELVDSSMPELLSKMLLEFFLNRTSKFSKNIESLYHNDKLSKIGRDLNTYQVKGKRLLISALLGFFAGSKWDGNFSSSGAIIVKENGEQVGFHLIETESLQDYLYENIKFDTPSTTRHRYGSLYIEHDKKLYFKLNLQLRF